MGLPKINETDYSNKGIRIQTNPMELPVANAQRKFDELTLDVIIPKFNSLATDQDTINADIENRASSLENNIIEKVDKVTGKGLSTNDFTNEDKELVNTISDKANLSDLNSIDERTGVLKSESMSGNAGKILANDGTNASWSNKLTTNNINSPTLWLYGLYNQSAEIFKVSKWSSEEQTGSYSYLTINNAGTIGTSGLNIVGQNIQNKNSNSSATITLNNNGVLITRNISDSAPALQINNINSASTGNIVDFQSAGINKAYVDKDGYYYSNGQKITTNIIDGEGTKSVRHISANSQYTAGNYSLALGYLSRASGTSSISMGHLSSTTESYSCAIGASATTSGTHSVAIGTNITSETYATHVIGRYNVANSGSSLAYSSAHNAFVIGNGTGTSAKSNAFRVTFEGTTYGVGAFNTSGADYAEYFEWEDGNPNNEDRRGFFVALNCDKIHIAQPQEEILGVISSRPAIIGNHYSEVWQGMFLTDDWGDYICEWQDVLEQKDEDGNIIQGATRQYAPKVNPEYDPEQEYIPREKRQEWSAVGMLGQLIIFDDGTCQPNGRCNVGVNGKGTASETGYRVLKRINENKVLILIK